jgi:hypothetical protein
MPAFRFIIRRPIDAFSLADMGSAALLLGI